MINEIEGLFCPENPPKKATEESGLEGFYTHKS